jgi:hypothetical protein
LAAEVLGILRELPGKFLDRRRGAKPL